MKYYQIKSTEKDARPPRWYRTLVPSGITFSQLYVLLAYIHDEVFDLSAYYEFETGDREIWLEEFDGSESENRSSFRDIYDTKGTYIDSFFHEGFKISQYTGRDFDLTIEVEKDAEDQPDLMVPKVIKVSRVIAEEEGGQPEGETLPEELFEVIPDSEQYFRCAVELADTLGSGSIMHVSEDPVTPEESVLKGSRRRSREALHEAMLPLYDDAELMPLLEQMGEEARDGGVPDRYLTHRIDNLMLRKYGMPLGEYSFIAGLKGMVPENEIPSDILRKSGRPPVSTEDFVNSYSKSDLELAAEDYGLALPANRSKKNLAKVILQQLFSPERIRERLIQLEDEEMELFRLTAESECGRFPETEDEEMVAEELVYSLLAVPLKGDRLFVTDLIRNVYEESDKDALETERQKSVWMYKCLDIARSFYGVMDWDVLGQLFARRFKGVSREELKEIFRRTPEIYSDFEELGDKLVLSYYIPNDYYKYLEERVQTNKQFYIPSRREVEEFYEKGCLLSSNSHQAMYRFLVNRIGYTPEKAELKVEEMYHLINNNERMQTVVDSLKEELGEEGAFASEKDFTDFAQLYMNMNNYSHLMANRGYTPNDLFIVAGGLKGLPKDMKISPRSPEAAMMLDQNRDELTKRGIPVDEKRIEALLEADKRKKIGRNEPCPCGSGKKYKNCCGK